MTSTLQPEERCYFRDQLRQARSQALLDGEGFHPIVAALERLGSMLNPQGKNLGQFRESLLAVAAVGKSAPATGDERALHMPLDVLFAAVKNGRNDAVHQGAYARHLVRHCIELALHIEDGLMADAKCVADYMVRDPACAQPWQPIALARQQMLTNSFSHLPLFLNERWNLLSDYAIASYLAHSSNPAQALKERIAVACERDALPLEPAVVVSSDTLIARALQMGRGRPVLVIEGARLLGIATPFDFL